MHGDEPSEVTPDQFRRFLVDSPLIRETIGGASVRPRKPSFRRGPTGGSPFHVGDCGVEVRGTTRALRLQDFKRVMLCVRHIVRRLFITRTIILWPGFFRLRVEEMDYFRCSCSYAHASLMSGAAPVNVTLAVLPIVPSLIVG